MDIISDAIGAITNLFSGFVAAAGRRSATGKWKTEALSRNTKRGVQ